MRTPVAAEEPAASEAQLPESARQRETAVAQRLASSITAAANARAAHAVDKFAFDATLAALAEAEAEFKEAKADAISLELQQLLDRVATELPPLVIIIVLRPLPVVEIARLACVHKAFWYALRSLRQQHPGRQYQRPSAERLQQASRYSRFTRAATFGDEALILAMLAAGVNERGVPLLRATECSYSKGLIRLTLDRAMYHAASRGHIQIVKLLLDKGANVHAAESSAITFARENGHTEIVNLLILRGALRPESY